MPINRRDFLKSTAAISLLAAPGLAGAQASGHTRLSSRGCGRATGYAEANKIVTLGDKTHAAWIDSDPDGFRVRIRTLDRSSGTWSDSVTIDEAYDNHGGPALTADSEGYLHIAYYPHHHPMRYRRSVRPNDASEWTPVVEVGDRATYPTLACGPDDTLYLSFRESSNEEPWHVDMYTKPKDAGEWQGPSRILQADVGGYAHFMEAFAWDWDAGVLHLATRLYGGDPPRGHTVGYMKTADQGKTWTKLDGTPIELPATSHSIDIVEQEREGSGVGLRAGSIAVGPNGRPYILCATYDDLPLEAWVTTPDDDQTWRRTRLRDFLPPEYAEWGVCTPGGITYSANGSLYVAAQIARPRGTKDTTIWGNPTTEVVLFESSDGGASFDSRVLTGPDSERPRWLPSLERRSGHHSVKGAPGLMYTDGGRGDNNKQILANDVYWVDL